MQAVIAAQQAGGAAPGRFAPGTRLLMLEHDGGPLCRVQDGRGLCVVTPVAGLRTLPAGRGAARVRRLLDRGIVCGLGTDVSGGYSPSVLEAARLVPMEQAERRVLVLRNPGLGGAYAITSSLFAGLQVILPGETAPSHHHTPAALRLIVEGHGAYTTVEGVKCVMEPGDLLSTGRDGLLTVGFADGSRVVMPSSSSARLIEAHGRHTRMELLNGRIESYVEKQREREFEIRTRTFALGVKGHALPSPRRRSAPSARSPAMRPARSSAPDAGGRAAPSTIARAMACRVRATAGMKLTSTSPLSTATPTAR